MDFIGSLAIRKASAKLLRGSQPTVDGSGFCSIECQCVRWRVSTDGGPRANRSAGPDDHRRNEHGAGTDKRVSLYDRAMLVYTVIVTRDRASPDINACADVCISHIGEMIHLGAIGQIRLLDFHKVAHMDIVPNDALWTQAGKGSDPRPTPNTRLVNHTIRQDFSSVR